MMIIERDTHTHTHSLEGRLASHGDLGAISHVVPARHGRNAAAAAPSSDGTHASAHLQPCLQG